MVVEFDVEMLYDDSETNLVTLLESEVEGNKEVAKHYGIDPLSISAGTYKFLILQTYKLFSQFHLRDQKFIN